VRPARGFREALSAPGFGAIAEFKRRSPSAGALRPGGEVAAVARGFEAAGARAMSVLVDERFGGSLADLGAAREACSLPLLAKGFFSSAEQLAELARAGADAALLLLRDLDDATCRALLESAQALGLDTLLEAHDAAELARARALPAPVIGVNARDLTSFAIDRSAQLALLASGPADRILVAESGIESRAQGALAELSGARAMLVGATLMRAPDPGAKLAELLARPLVKVCGLTRQADVDAAVEAGADMVGFILARESPRAAEAVLEAPPAVLRVAVFVGEERASPADLHQLYAREGDHRARDGVLRRGGREVASVVDLPWGAGDESQLERARAREGRVMLAGGLRPGNVRAAIDAVSPWAVDAARGTESSPGVKDHAALRAFVEAAR
jgi:indole-3-glycerol phosphate synthase/phosphoribosylanthranilate isomerase